MKGPFGIIDTERKGNEKKPFGLKNIPFDSKNKPIKEVRSYHLQLSQVVCVFCDELMVKQETKIYGKEKAKVYQGVHFEPQDTDLYIKYACAKCGYSVVTYLYGY